MMSLPLAAIGFCLCLCEISLVLSQDYGFMSTTAFPTRADDNQVTVPPANGPLVDSIEQYPGMSFPSTRGRHQPTFMSRDACYKNCFQNRGCQGFTWNADKWRCVFYLQDDDVCSGLIVDAKTTFYKLRARCFDFSTCQVKTMLKLGYMHGGQPVPFDTIDECSNHCMAKKLCYAFSYNINAKICYFHSTTGLPFMKNDCCLTYVKMCSDEAKTQMLNPTTAQEPSTGSMSSSSTTTLTTDPTTPPTTPTTAPPTVPTGNPYHKQTTPPDLTGLLDVPQAPTQQSGCPHKFQEVKYMSQHGGMEVLSAVTVPACQKFCLDQGTLCVAIDFNTDVIPHTGPACFWHSVITPMAVSVEGSVIRYVRTNCVEKQCAAHDPQTITLPPRGTSFTTLLAFQTLLASPTRVLQPAMDVTTPSCQGNCVTKATSVSMSGVASELILERSCHAIAPPFFKCKLQDTTDGSTERRSASCSCYGDKCNVIGPATIMAMEGYYPFDASGKSYAGDKRNAFDFGIIYDVTDKKKNVSAMFNGVDAYFEVPSFAYQSIGYREGAGGAALTVTFWFKQTAPDPGQTTEKQTILSNGDINYSSLSIYTTSVDPSNVLLNVDLTLKSMRYHAMGMVTMDSWTFVALTLTPVEADGNHVLRLYVNDVMNPTQMLDIAVPPAAVDATNGAAGLDIKSFPLVIGAAFDILPDKSVLGFKYFLKGKMDELFISYSAESAATLMSLKYMTDQPHNFNP